MEPGYTRSQIIVPEHEKKHLYDGDTYVGMIHPVGFIRPDRDRPWAALRAVPGDPNTYRPAAKTEEGRDVEFATAEEAEAAARAAYEEAR